MSGQHGHDPEQVERMHAAALPTHQENLRPLSGRELAPNSLTRRDMLALTGAAAALATGLTGCDRKPKREIVSRVSPPEYQKPGQALYYSSTWTEGPHPYGMLVKAVDGRPVKIEGNPDHPLNQGSSSAAMQATLLSLYDPDRLRGPRKGDTPVSWEEADQAVIQALKGDGVALMMTSATLGPSESALIRQLQTLRPGLVHCIHDPLGDSARQAAWKRVFGHSGHLVPRLDKAKVIVSLDCDFMGTDGPTLEQIRGYTVSRSLEGQDPAQATMSRLYCLEAALTQTGAQADHRLRVRPGLMAEIVIALRATIAGDILPLEALASRESLDIAVLRAMAHDLAAHPGESVVLAGGHLPQSVHEQTALLNATLNAMGTTLEWYPKPDSEALVDRQEIARLLGEGPALLLLLDVNPVYDWPGGGFDTWIGKAGLAVGHGQYLDETLSRCGYALAGNHNLESWNDASPRAGIVSVCQPLITPLYDTRQMGESLLRWAQALAPEEDPLHALPDWYAYVKGRHGDDKAWQTFLHTGVRVEAAAVPTPPLTAVEPGTDSLAGEGSYELVFRPHHALYDGRWANNPWLHELPEPISKLVWDCALSMSPATAATLGVTEGDVVTVRAGDAVLDIPALVQPGHANGAVSVCTGYGRTAGGVVVTRAGGVSVYPLMTSAGTHPRRVEVTKGTGRTTLVRAQKEFSMHDRPIVLEGDLADYHHDTAFVQHLKHLPRDTDLYTPSDYSKGYKWAMAIDMHACVGCGACMTACQAENNIPVVGREQFGKGREMFWMRIDTYYDGTPEQPIIRHLPMLCQHCDNAPCENVCPVFATAHSPEGLNEMAYNRCVGTRYCSLNCPYKVRKFNYFRYHKEILRDPVQELAFNPQVTVREVGVMEKCTFCVQRINESKYAAANRGDKMPDRAVRTACQQACPAQAIHFGDVNTADSDITTQRRNPRAYHVLEELNVKPNVTYLARVRNPHPDLAGPVGEGGHT